MVFDLSGSNQILFFFCGIMSTIESCTIRHCVCVYMKGLSIRLNVKVKESPARGTDETNRESERSKPR